MSLSPAWAYIVKSGLKNKTKKESVFHRVCNFIPLLIYLASSSFVFKGWLTCSSENCKKCRPLPGGSSLWNPSVGALEQHWPQQCLVSIHWTTSCHAMWAAHFCVLSYYFDLFLADVSRCWNGLIIMVMFVLCLNCWDLVPMILLKKIAFCHFKLTTSGKWLIRSANL